MLYKLVRLIHTIVNVNLHWAESFPKEICNLNDNYKGGNSIPRRVQETNVCYFLHKGMSKQKTDYLYLTKTHLRCGAAHLFMIAINVKQMLWYWIRCSPLKWLESERHYWCLLTNTSTKNRIHGILYICTYQLKKRRIKVSLWE